jgi:hypothetical protein
MNREKKEKILIFALFYGKKIKKGKYEVLKIYLKKTHIKGKRRICLYCLYRDRVWSEGGSFFTIEKKTEKNLGNSSEFELANESSAHRP